MAITDTLRSDASPLDSEEALREHINRALAARPLSGLEAKLTYRIAQWWFRTRLFNENRLPQQPCVFVGNHALFGLDGMVILPVMQELHGRFLRPMGDKFLFSNPQIASQLLRRGAVMGHPEVARALMAHGQDILVFPGGAHEAVKASRDRYTLQWKDRLGFLRLAAEYGYTIQPFALVGPDEFFEYLLDSDELVAVLKRLGLWSDAMRADAIPPLARGTFASPIPRPQPCYLSFAEPLELPTPGKRAPSRQRLLAWREEVEKRIETELNAMLLRREQDRPQFSLLRRLATL
jgi:1-acyl-sn-glycerol-3-phosphate acyltransferase